MYKGTIKVLTIFISKTYFFKKYEVGLWKSLVEKHWEIYYIQGQADKLELLGFSSQFCFLKDKLPKTLNEFYTKLTNTSFSIRLHKISTLSFSNFAETDETLSTSSRLLSRRGFGYLPSDCLKTLDRRWEAALDCSLVTLNSQKSHIFRSGYISPEGYPSGMPGPVSLHDRPRVLN